MSLFRRDWHRSHEPKLRLRAEAVSSMSISTDQNLDVDKNNNSLNHLATHLVQERSISNL